jgi:hypothetical protein
MQKPSQQFVTKLETELRLAYRGQYHQTKRPFTTLLKFLVPAISGALVITILIVNFKADNVGKVDQPVNIQAGEQDFDEGRLLTFNEGADEEEIVQNFDNEELNQIDNGVQLVAQGNY